MRRDGSRQLGEEALQGKTGGMWLLPFPAQMTRKIEVRAVGKQFTEPDVERCFNMLWLVCRLLMNGVGNVIN